MAGEMEEPFSLDFQADSLHSGSISFGRFERECLSWEKRSSFSHNRYLEEVEKYSKPGSVTEKKAYFEAHFKKKALLLQSSSECQNGMEHQTCENSMSENRDKNNREEIEYVNNEGDHFIHFDESPDGSDYQGDCQEMEFVGDDMEISNAEPQVEPAYSDVDCVVNSVLTHPKSGEAHQTATGCDKLPLVNAEPDTEVKQNVYKEVLNDDVLLKATDLSTKTQDAEKDDNLSSEWQNPSPKLKASPEMKPIKPRLKSQANFSEIHRNILGGASKDSARIPSRREGVNLLRMKAEKQSSQASMLATPSIHRTLKAEESEGLKAKLVHENKSEKELKAKKVVVPRPSTPEKFESRERQAANRPKRTVNSTNQDIRQSAGAFNFKSDERAERRKEFYTRLEEKMHAKEAEMNKIQARTQEKTQAEIKQFRSSLNFKATPLPSFYHEVAQRGSDCKKAVSANTKSTKSRSKSSNPGSKSEAGIPSNSKEANDRALSASDSVDTNDPPQASGSTNCPSAEPSEASAISPTLSSRSRHFQAGTKKEVAGRKERDKKDTTSHKHRISEGSKMNKGQRTEEQQKVGTRGGSNVMVRKDMKRVGIGSGSGMGSLPVGVAS